MKTRKRKMLIVCAIALAIMLFIVACSAGEFRTHTVFTNEDGGGSQTLNMYIMRNDGDPSYGLEGDDPSLNWPGAIDVNGDPTDSTIKLTPQELTEFLNDVVAENERLTAAGIEVTLDDTSDVNFYIFSWTLEFDNMAEYNAIMRNKVGYNMTDSEWARRNFYQASFVIDSEEEEIIFTQDASWKRRAIWWATAAIFNDEDVFDQELAGLEDFGMHDSIVYEQIVSTFDVQIDGKEHYTVRNLFRMSAYAAEVTTTSITVGNDYLDLSGVVSTGLMTGLVNVNNSRHRLLQAAESTDIGAIEVDGAHYTIVTIPGMDVNGWTNTATALTDRIIDGLTSDTEYFLQARWNALSHAWVNAEGDRNLTSTLFPVRTLREDNEAPEAPTVTASGNTLTVTVPSGMAGWMEFRVLAADGTTELRPWQTSNVFAGLARGTEYRVEARFASLWQVSPISDATAISTEDRLSAEAPTVPPTVATVGTTINATAPAGYVGLVEFALFPAAGLTEAPIVNWQGSGTFEGRSYGAIYVVAMRTAQTDEYAVSLPVTTNITMGRRDVATPGITLAGTATISAVTMTVPAGYANILEWRLLAADGTTVVRDWQESNVFNNLDAGISFRVEARLRQTVSDNASPATAQFTISTLAAGGNGESGCSGCGSANIAAGLVALLALGGVALFVFKKRG